MINYKPPFEITGEMATLVVQITELLGSFTAAQQYTANPKLRRENRIQSIYSSLAIEQNRLSLNQVTAIIDGKRVIGPADDILEVQNANRAYRRIQELNPSKIDDLRIAHQEMMTGLLKNAGQFRREGVGVFEGDTAIHIAPQANLVPQLMEDLFAWMSTDKTPMLIKSCVFHYEFEFIHPFADGNGRIGRLWHTLLLGQWRSMFLWLPIESVIKERQEAYYLAIRRSTAVGKSNDFIVFMLQAIYDALLHQVQEAKHSIRMMSDQVIRLLKAMDDMPASAKELMAKLNLVNRTSFKKLYLDPAIHMGLIEMTIPESPNNRNQKYIKK